jgi:hypothetical protein
MQGFGWETLGRKPLGRGRPIWEDIIKTDVQEV